MAWTTPRTYTTGEVITAATLNTDHRDNISFLYNAPSCVVYSTAAAQNHTNATTLYPLFNAELFDNDTIHDTSTNTSRLTCRTAGVYLIVATFAWSANATGRRLLGLEKNRATELTGQNVPAVGGGLDTTLETTTYAKLAVGDYVELRAYQDSGATLTGLVTGEKSPRFGMTWVSAG